MDGRGRIAQSLTWVAPWRRSGADPSARGRRDGATARADALKDKKPAKKGGAA
jgi:hypothetical protein